MLILRMTWNVQSEQEAIKIEKFVKKLGNLHFSVRCRLIQSGLNYAFQSGYVNKLVLTPCCCPCPETREWLGGEKESL